MPFHNNNNPIKKNTFCKYGCQTAIKFDNRRVSAKEIKIPLNLDGSPHDCPKRPSSYNKGTITCKYCTQPITFDNNIKSKSGKKIPLNLDGTYHNCPRSAFNLSQRDANDDDNNDTKKENDS
jgi:hypothetical protein